MNFDSPFIVDCSQYLPFQIRPTQIFMTLREVLPASIYRIVYKDYFISA